MDEERAIHMSEMPRHFTFNPAEEPGATPITAPAVSRAGSDNAHQPIGVMLEIAGSGSQIALDLQRLGECMADEDPSIALAGQVGSQVKVKTQEGWLLASVRIQERDRRCEGCFLANVAFVGVGMGEKLTGTIRGFRRGVALYPLRGALIYPVTTEDLRQIYA